MSISVAAEEVTGTVATYDVGEGKNYITLAEAYADVRANNQTEAVFNIYGAVHYGASPYGNDGGTAFTATFVGKTEDATLVYDGNRDHEEYAWGGDILHFENVAINMGNYNYCGTTHSAEETYDNCTVNGQIFLYAGATAFNNCVFNQNSANAYNVWTYTSAKTVFNECVFNSVGKSVLVYNESGASEVLLEVEECEFNASAPVEGKAAIEIDTTYMKSSVIVDEDTQVNGFAAGNKSGDTLWNHKTIENNVKDAVVVVADEMPLCHTADTTSYVAYIGTKGYATITDAIAAANAGDTIIITEGTYDAFSINKSNISVIGTGDVNINGKLGVSASGVYIANLNVSNPSGTAFSISGNGEIENCTLIGSNGVRYSYANDGDVKFEECTIVGDVYGVHFDAGNGEGNVIIEDCEVTGWTSFGSAIENVIIEEVTFKNGNYNVLRFYQDAEVTDCTFNPEMRIDSGDGGMGMEGISLEFNGCEVTDGTPVDDLIYYAVTAKGDVKVDGAAPTGLIADKEDLLAFAEMVNGGNDFKGKTVKLGADIEMMDENGIIANMVPIGKSDHPFRGTFDGQGHKISNLYITYFNGDDFDGAYVGLFGKTSEATIKNVTVHNPYLVGASYVGGIVGCAYTGTVENCHVTGEIDIEGYYMVGGITGHGYAKIKDCSVVGAEGWDYNFIGAEYHAKDLEGDNVGGIIGHRAEGSGAVISGCHAENITVAGTRKVGGIVGIAFLNNTIENCSVKNVTVKTVATKEYAEDNKKSMGVGGIVGLFQNTSSHEGQIVRSRVENVTLANENNVEASMGYITGGLRASADTDLPVEPDLATYAEVFGVNSGATNGFMSTAQSIIVSFVKNDDDETGRTYNIVLSGDKGAVINDFESAHFTFVNGNRDKIDYTITANTELDITAVDDITNPDRISFYRNANDTNSNEIASETIVLGTVTFGGYGDVIFSIDSNDAKVNATTMADSIVNTYLPKGSPYVLTLKEDNFNGVKFEEQARNLNVVIKFNNDVANQVKEYTEMKVTVTGQNGEKHDAEIGSDSIAINGNTVTLPFTVTAGYRYTVKVEGAGYRTAEYTTVVGTDSTDDVTLTFWNNVKDEFNKTEIESGSDRWYTKNFLAGEIVQDNKINKYDLAAVVSYFGEDNLVGKKNGYNKYDLNRDGVIDSEDIAYVLVSFGE